MNSPERSPLGAPQTFCEVQVRKRSVKSSAVRNGAIKPLSQDRLWFAAFERGLECEMSHLVARVPLELPPLHDVLRMAAQEFDIQLPSMEGARMVRERKRRPAAVASQPAAGCPPLPVCGVVFNSIVPILPPEEETRGKTPADLPASGRGAKPGRAARRPTALEVVLESEEEAAGQTCDGFVVDCVPSPAGQAALNLPPLDIGSVRNLRTDTP